ncbi:hypothetical protein MKZ38_007560 [Zalerion maritima]|uniref:Uncharacterized protein n=1 Tax=Zalerion maritima TaxID=339359 RepID=A0AAD5WN66_9PEZI|nr:hypothetical protein MKZ38_007560 [Zalerion maritima]
MAAAIPDRYAGLVAESTDNVSVSSARILLLDRAYPSRLQTQPHRQRRLQKPPPSMQRPKSPASPSYPPRPISLPPVPERPISRGWPRDSSRRDHVPHHQQSQYFEGSGSGTGSEQSRANGHARTRSLGSGFILRTESSRPRVRSSGLATVATRDGKLVKPMGPGEPKPLTAQPLSNDDDDSLGGWTRRWEKIRGLWRR